ncbi:MAG: dienelactone hydrolase family protein [Casimicrobiaceae bacterium]
MRAYVRLSAGAAKPRPAVIICIGSLGLASGREALYADALCAAGIAAIVVDSFASRNFVETLSDQGRLSQAAACADVLYALKHLAGDRCFAAGRIGLLGYSRGGATVLLAGDERLQAAVLGAKLRFAAQAALYPSVWPRWQNPRPADVPILMIAGGRDDLAPLPMQKATVARLQRCGASVELIVCVDACHSFDAAHSAHRDDNNLNMSACDVVVDDRGVMHDLKSGCEDRGNWAEFVGAVAATSATRGATTGHGPQGPGIAAQFVVDFFKRTLTV